mgnify:CR=1 FL=1
MHDNIEPNFDTYISRDEIRFALVAEDEPYFSREDEVYECFINEIRQALLEYDHVFVDATQFALLNSSKIFYVSIKQIEMTKPQNLLLV